MNLLRVRRVVLQATIIAAAVSLVASGCSGPAPVPSPRPSLTPSASPTPTPTPPPVALAPLRGTIIPTGSLNHASIAAKIDNQIDARPQIGLESTDMVFEELVEGGLTRYLAIWQSTIPAVIGPVRSIRPMDPLVVSSFGGIICYSGGQDQFIALMRQAPVYNAIQGQPDTASTFYRTSAKRAPHNVLVKAQDVLAQHPTIAPPPQQFSYSADIATSTAVKEGTPSATLKLAFSTASRPSWAYDATQQAFLRSQNGVVDVDSNKTQLKSTNVVTLRVAITPAVTDPQVPKTELVGNGDAWVSTGGSTVQAKWSKASPTDTIHLVDASGATINLAPGNTWIEMVPNEGSVAFVAPPAA